MSATRLDGLCRASLHADCHNSRCRCACHHPDQWLQLVNARRAGPCDCPCHGYPNIACRSCCINRGRRWIPAVRLYEDWENR